MNTPIGTTYNKICNLEEQTVMQAALRKHNSELNVATSIPHLQLCLLKFGRAATVGEKSAQEGIPTFHNNINWRIYLDLTSFLSLK